MALGRTVLALVASPHTAAQLGELAGRVAKRDDGEVVALSIMALDGQEASAREAARAAAAAAEEVGVPARARALAHRSVVAAVRAERADAEASLVLMGWRAPEDPGEFGRLVDQLVDDADAPLLLARPGPGSFRRTVVALSDDELLAPDGDAVAEQPADSAALGLALARAVADHDDEQALVVRTGERRLDLPVDARLLGGPLHQDPRPLAQVLASIERADDAVIVPVAPLPEALERAATLPSVGSQAWLLVPIAQRHRPHAPLAQALDEAPVPEDADADEPVPAPTSQMVIVEHGTSGRYEVVVTVTGVGAEADTTVAHRLAAVGIAGPVEPRADAQRQWLEGSVVIEADSATAAVGRVVAAMDRASDLRQAEITYHVRALPRQG